MWNVNFITIFPEIFESFLKTSLIGKAVARGLLSTTTTNIRDFSKTPHNKVDVILLVRARVLHAGYLYYITPTYKFQELFVEELTYDSRQCVQ